MADTNRVLVGLVAESQYGTTPASPAFQTMRVTSASAAPRVNVVRTREIRSDRQVTDEIQTFKDATGDLGGEVSFGAQDFLLTQAQCSNWSNKSTDSFTAIAATTITLSAAHGATYPKGGLVLVTNSSVAANNKIFGPLGAAGSGSTITISGGQTDNSPSAGASVKLVGIECATGDCVASISPTKLTISGTSGDWTTFGLAAGDWVKVGGSAAANQYATAATNGYCRVLSVTATVLTFDRTPTGFAADNGAGKQIRVAIADRLTNGTTLISATQKRYFSDLTVYEYTKGMAVSRATIGGQTGGLLEATYSYEGAFGSVQGSALSGETDLAAPAWMPMNMNANVGRLGVGGSQVAGPNYVTRASFTLNNNLRKRIPIGFDTTQSMGMGTFDAQLTLETYFGDSTLYSAVLARTESSFDMAVSADAGGAYLFDAPRIVAASGTPTVPGVDQDVMLPITYQLLRDKTLGYTLNIQRFSGSL